MHVNSCPYSILHKIYNVNNPGLLPFKTKKVIEGNFINENDHLAVEEPLEIRLQFGPVDKPIQQTASVTMRTPGNDTELAAGFLFTEGILQYPSQIKMVIPEADGPNTVLIVLNDNIQPVLNSLQKNFYTTSGCGICGKTSIEAIRTVSIFGKDSAGVSVSTTMIYSLPDKVKNQQALFESTGGLHASALFDVSGNFMMLKEDVGRHNALDKLIGQAFLENNLPLSKYILFLSGRASFELVQKAYMAGIKIIAAVGAPSSLAAELSSYNDITLIGFLRGNRFNVYHGSERIS